MPKKKTYAEISAELDLLKRSRLSDGIVSVINNLIKYGFLAIAFYYSYRMVDALAGKETISNIAFKMITDLKMNQWMAYAIGGCGLSYGLAERSVRKKTVTRLHSRIEELELKKDPKRTSSMLTSTGDTRPEDKL